MCKVSKDHEKIADFAKMYNYIMNFKRSLFWSLNDDLGNTTCGYLAKLNPLY